MQLIVYTVGRTGGQAGEVGRTGDEVEVQMQNKKATQVWSGERGFAWSRTGLGGMDEQI